jgi:hypothetical protein
MSQLRKGMWAIHAGQRAIINGLAPNAAEVHYVNEDGETIGMNIVDPAALEQATFADIPAARAPTAKVAAKFGYL